jgi:peptidoglycan hydrolase CwlO-like protein
MSTATTSTLDSFQSYVEELSLEKLQISVKLKCARVKIDELQQLIEQKEEEIKRLKKALGTL